jgi:hypothetical protein
MDRIGYVEDKILYLTHASMYPDISHYPYIIKGLEDHSPNVRKTAALSLVRNISTYRYSIDIRMVKDCLTAESDHKVKCVLLQLVGGIGDDAIVECQDVLIDCANESDDSVALCALQVIDHLIPDHIYYDVDSQKYIKSQKPLSTLSVSHERSID